MSNSLLDDVAALLDAASLGVVAIDHDGTIIMANATLEAMFGYAPSELLGRPLETLLPEALRNAHRAHRDDYVAAPHKRPMGQGIDLVGRHKDGHTFAIEASLSQFQIDGRAVPVAFVVDVSTRKQHEHERDLLLLQERQARAQAEAAQRRQEFLSEASRLLASTLDYEQTLANLSQSVIPFLGDCCTVDLLVDGVIQRVAAGHALPEKEVLLRAFRQQYKSMLNSTRPLATTLSAGQPIVIREIAGMDPAMVGHDPALLDLVRQLGVRSALLVPLAVRGQILGVLGLYVTETERQYDQDDLALAQELALLAAQAIENAQLLRQSQEAARRADETLALLNTVVQSAPIGFAFVDRSLRYRVINTQLAEINGFPPAAHLGHTARELYPELADYIEPVLQHVLDTGEAILDVEASGVLPSRPEQIRHWSCSYYPVHTSSGEVLGVGSMVVDITARKQAEASLRASEERFRLLADHAHDIIYRYRLAPTRGYEYVSPSVITLTGYTPEEHYADPDLGFKTVHPDDLDLLLAPPSSGDVSQVQTLRWLHKDGSLHWTEQYNVPIYDDSGALVAIQGVVRDITERKQADEMRALLAAIVASSDDAIVAVSLSGTIMSWNDGATRLFGYTAEEIIGRPIALLRPPNLQEEVVHIYEQLALGESTIHHETVRLRKDGRPVDVVITFSPINDSGGAVIGASTITRDVTARKRVDDALRRQSALTQLLQVVASAANQASSVDEALHAAVSHVCACIGWPVGHAYLRDEARPDQLISTGIWHLDRPEHFAIFRTITDAVPIVSGKDMPGLALSTGQPVWIADITTHSVSVRAQLIRDIGVRAGFAFPVFVGGEVVAVLEFFASEPQGPDEALLEVMANVGAQLGRVVERVRSEAALRATEARYRTLVEQIPAIIYTAAIDAHSSTSYVSPQIEAILGFTAEEWLSDPLLWLKQVHPDDQQRVLANVARVQGSDLPLPTEYRCFTRDGRLVWLQDAARTVRDEAGQPLFMQGITLDITERKHAEQALRRSEQLYRTLAHNFPKGAVFLYDHDLRLTIADGQALVTAGFSREMLEGKTLREVLPPASFATQEPLYRAALAGVQNMGETTADGFTFMTYYLPVRNERDEIFAGLAVTHDITELKRAEQALAEERALLARRVAERTADLSAANAQLARAARLKDEFLASMSHELRTPLNAVLGLSEALREQAYGALNEKQDRALRTVEESSRHLLDLINDILDLAKIGAGKLELVLEETVVEQLCLASVRMVRQAAQQKQISVRVALDPQARYVMADARRLKQILVNLLTNAVKFTPAEGSVGLEVQADAMQHALRFTVWDTGIGIAPHQLEQLFQPFVQLDSRLARQYEGTGLGLALVYRMAELHGGSVAVTSHEGIGSRFTVSLPWYIERPATTLRVLEAAPIVATRLPQRALIIEDSPTAAELAARHLAELGIISQTLTYGGDAVSRAREFQPGLILLDLILPDISGWDVLHQLKAAADTRAIPVIIASVVDDETQGLARGAAAHLVKPIARADLHRVVEGLFREGAPLPAATQPQRAAPSARRPTILLAEDNEANILTVADYLEFAGYHVLVARNGAEALERARETLPALIVMDVQMPGMDGLEAMQHIRRDLRLASIPIIALTALAMPGDQERCLAAGANAYLSKPVGLKELAAMVASQLRRSGESDQSREQG
jgi:PAS domain S-box-containing protein